MVQRVGMTPQDIRKVLIDRNLEMREIARRIQCPPPQVSFVIGWKRKTPWIRRGIAKVLGIPYLLMWGEDDPKVDWLPRGRGPRGVTGDNKVSHKVTSARGRK